MTKTYKHKTLGWIAECLETNERVCIGSGPMLGIWCSVEEVLSLGFEEVVEKDWVSKLRYDIDEYVTNNGYMPNEMMFRASVENHAPKQKKITKEQFEKVASDNNLGYRSMYMNRLRNLLYDNDLIEDFEY